MKTHCEFRSDAFSEGSDAGEQARGGQSADRLARFLANGLRAAGFATGEPVVESWGRLMRVENEDFPLWIGCGEHESHPDAFFIFIEPHTSMIRRLFKRIDTSPRVAALQRAIEAVLARDASIRERRWGAQDEFD